MQNNISFLELIQDKRVEIPVIQRDYAQGRTTEKTNEIRGNFLNEITMVLERDSDELLLDFVYGSLQGKKFIPLDGQQRLTTLFLLHWYLIPGDGMHRLQYTKDELVHSRFTYNTRTSSRDFCDFLVRRHRTAIESAEETLSGKIVDQPGFMWEWQNDPTVAGMLVMLDELDDRLNGSDIPAMWEKLENGRIAFHLLDLEEFNLTDKLYVKMNARGKDLSGFDIFKSTLEEQMRINRVPERLQNKWRENVDSRWIDLFWDKDAVSKEKEKVVGQIEEKYLRFLKRLMVFHLFTDERCMDLLLSDSKTINREFKRLKLELTAESELADVLDALRRFSVMDNGDVLRLMGLFCKTGFFSDAFFAFAIEVFESLIYEVDGKRKDISTLLSGVLFEGLDCNVTLFDAFVADKINYETRVQFFALLQFALYRPACRIWGGDPGLQDELREWMRIIRNLSTRTNTHQYNTYKELGSSIRRIARMTYEIYGSTGDGHAVGYFEGYPASEGFNGDQFREECRKTALFATPGWADAIKEFEEKPYFTGQIRFLLDWADGDLGAFKRYGGQMSALFGPDGLTVDQNLFRSSLLYFGSYGMSHRGWNFLKKDNKDRDASWKRFLREGDKCRFLKDLLDDKALAQGDITALHEDILKRELPTDWRRYFILRPDLFNYMAESKYNFWSSKYGNLILISKLNLAAPNVELRTYYWHLMFKRDGDSYRDSKEEEHRFSADFHRAGKNISVKYVPDYNHAEKEWAPGRYVVSTDYDSGLPQLAQADDGRWECWFDLHQDTDVEELLKILLGA